MITLIDLLFIGVSLLAAVIWHEIGHMYAARYYGLKYTLSWHYENWLHWGLKVSVDGVGEQQLQNILLSGILFGLIPIGFFVLITNIKVYMAIPMYLYGCRADILKLIQIVEYPYINSK